MEFKGIVWAGLLVEDMEKEVAFFRDSVGLRLLREGAEGVDRWAHFSTGGSALFELFSGGIAAKNEKEPHQQSISIAFQVDDIDEVMTAMRANGVHFTSEVEQYRNQRWVTFLDPENNRLEIKEIRATTN